MVFYNGILTAPGKEMERQTDHAIKSTSVKCAVFVNESVFGYCRLTSCFAVLCLQVCHR